MGIFSCAIKESLPLSLSNTRLYTNGSVDRLAGGGSDHSDHSGPDSSDQTQPSTTKSYQRQTKQKEVEVQFVSTTLVAEETPSL